MRNLFDFALSNIVGLTCWGAIAGKGTGSMVTLDFGERKPLSPPLQNPALSAELTQFQGEYCVFVQRCAWRLEEKQAIICAWGDNEETIGREIERLVGGRLTKAELLNWTFDLRLSFDNRYSLHLFCDQTVDGADNYSVRTPSGWYLVRSAGELIQPNT